MRVLVTGAAGFIGSHVVDALLEEECEVVGIDALIGPAHECVPELPAEVEFHRIDLRDADALEAIVRGVDAVSHQASMVGLGTSFDDVADYAQHNDVGTAVLLRSLYRTRFRGRLVLAGSMVVYGEGGYTCIRHGRVTPPPRRPEQLSRGRFDPLCPACGRDLTPVAIGEDTPPDPRNVYAATKLHQEHLCRAFERETGVEVAALRYHNVYGPRMPRDTPYSGVASIFRSALEAGRAPEVFEDGRQMRDFVHVTDVARANLLCLLRSEAVTGAFNISSGDVRTVGEVAETLSEVSRSQIRPRATGAFRLGDVRHLFAPPHKAREVLGFEPLVSFERGMQEFASAPLRGADQRQPV